MAEKFFAEMLVRSEINPASQRLELSICDVAGQSMMLSVGPDVIAALAQIMLDFGPGRGISGARYENAEAIRRRTWPARAVCHAAVRG